MSIGNEILQNRFGQATKINTIASLAGAQEEDEFSGLTGLPEGVREALKEQAQKQKSEQAKAAAQEILVVLNKSKAATTLKVGELRDLRARAKQKKEEIEAITLATAYGNESGNYLPLLRVMGDITEAQAKAYGAAAAVPAGWAPAAAAEQAAG